MYVCMHVCMCMSVCCLFQLQQGIFIIPQPLSQGRTVVRSEKKVLTQVSKSVKIRLVESTQAQLFFSEKKRPQA